MFSSKCHKAWHFEFGEQMFIWDEKFGQIVTIHVFEGLCLDLLLILLSSKNSVWKQTRKTAHQTSAILAFLYFKCPVLSHYRALFSIYSSLFLNSLYILSWLAFCYSRLSSNLTFSGNPTWPLNLIAREHVMWVFTSSQGWWSSLKSWKFLCHYSPRMLGRTCA